MRSLITAAAVSAFSFAVSGAGPLTAPNMTVGRNLQTLVSIILPQPSPPEGLAVTLTSDDPARLLLAAAPDKPGAASITLTLRPRVVLTPDFWVQGLAASGTVQYTFTVPGMGSAKGTVTLGQSGIAILGPFHAPKFLTTPRGVPANITLASALLDSSGKVVEEQQIAGGRNVQVALGNSNPTAGSLQDSKLTLAGGTSVASTFFKPSAEGSATLTLTQPEGFTPPEGLSSVIAEVKEPGIAITSKFTLGKNLQLLGVLCLGEAAPEGGLKVELASSDPHKLVLSANEDQAGSGSLTLTVPKGELTAKYYLQGLADSGSVTYTAAAPGFRTRTANIDLAPSGFIVAYEGYGPPDEATVLREGSSGHEERRFYPSLAAAKEKPPHVVVYSAYLDPARGLAADITVQPLRAGVTATVVLNSSNSAVGLVDSPLTIPSGSSHVRSRFTPLKLGETVVAVQTPLGFSTPKNATSAPATVVP